MKSNQTEELKEDLKLNRFMWRSLLTISILYIAVVTQAAADWSWNPFTWFKTLPTPTPPPTTPPAIYERNHYPHPTPTGGGAWQGLG